MDKWLVRLPVKVVGCAASTSEEKQKPPRKAVAVSTSNASTSAETEAVLVQEVEIPIKKKPVKCTSIEKQKLPTEAVAVSISNPSIPAETDTEVVLVQEVEIPIKKKRPNPKVKNQANSSNSGSDKKRNLYFNPSWLNVSEFKDWLQKHNSSHKGNEYAYCKICDKKIIAHKVDLRRHCKSNSHIANTKTIANTLKLPEMVNNPINDRVKRAELKLCGLLATQNLPFSLMDILAPLCANIFADSKVATNMALHRSKATALLKNGLGDNLNQCLFRELSEPACFFSIIMDETTDVGTIKQCAFTIIYYCTNSKRITTRFFDMRIAESGTAEALYNCLRTAITEKKIPYENLVGFSSDTCNTMFGEQHSVVSLLKKEQPEVVCIKCSCHLIHLAASKACAKLPRSVEDLLRNLGSHFSRSHGRQKKLAEIQEFFKVDIHKILYPSITRWLSLKACVDRVLEQYDTLTSYLRVVVFEDPSRTTEDMLQTITNKYTKVYLEFMSFNLGLLTDFNTMFQQETPLLHKVKPETERLLKNLYGSFLELRAFKTKNVNEVDHKDPRNFVSLEKIYLGIEATETLDQIKTEAENQNPDTYKSELNVFLKSCLNFYLELCSQIKARFEFKDEIYEMVDILNPHVAQSYRIKSLGKVISRYKILSKFVCPQSLDNEWREHAFLNHGEHNLDPNEEADDYWKKAFSLQNAAGKPLFPNLEYVIKFLLVLPYSNASVERIFSALKKIKTDQRNKLSTETIASIIHTKQGIEQEGGLLKFEPSLKMLKSKIWK